MYLEVLFTELGIVSGFDIIVVQNLQHFFSL